MSSVPENAISSHTWAGPMWKGRSGGRCTRRRSPSSRGRRGRARPCPATRGSPGTGARRRGRGRLTMKTAAAEGAGWAYRRIRAAAGRIGATDGGALVAAMAPPGQEIIIGVTRDLQFGHAVMFGLGGIMVEGMKDVSFRIGPLTGRDAAEMVAEIRGAGVLAGVGGEKRA